MNPDSSIELANRGDFHSGELTHKASLCVPPIYIVHEPYVLFTAKIAPCASHFVRAEQLTMNSDD